MLTSATGRRNSNENITEYGKLQETKGRGHGSGVRERGPGASGNGQVAKVQSDILIKKVEDQVLNVYLLTNELCTQSPLKRNVKH